MGLLPVKTQIRYLHPCAYFDRISEYFKKLRNHSEKINVKLFILGVSLLVLHIVIVHFFKRCSLQHHWELL